MATGAIVGCGGEPQPTRPVYHNFTLAAADSLPTLEPPARKYFQFSQFQIQVSLNERGEITDIETPQETDSTLATFLTDRLHELKFYPSLRDSLPVASVLPVGVITNYPGEYTRFTFPVNSNNWQVTPLLYKRGLELNGFVLPRLTRVPSYYTGVTKADRFMQTPFRWYEVTLGRSGRPLAINSLGGTYPGYDHQLKTVLNWSTYEVPPETDTTRLYVVFALYPGLNYATAPFTFGNSDSLSTLERLRIQILADTLGPILLPMPVRSPDSLISIPKTTVPRNPGPWSALIKIDTTGRVELVTRYFEGNQVRQVYKYIAKNERFYPALDRHSRPVAYEGLTYLTFVSDTTIRIEFGWISEYLEARDF